MQDDGRDRFARYLEGRHCLSQAYPYLARATDYILKQSMDFTDVPASEHNYVAGLLADGRGHQVRKLQLSIRLLPIAYNEAAELAFTRAVSTEIAVQILSSVPRLQWLEIELCSMNSPHYISRLSQSLKEALASHTQLKHFGVTCEGHVNDIPFQLDETLVAEIVPGFPNLSSLTLHRIGCDTLLRTSPLFDAVASLKHLKSLNILEVQALTGTWAARPIGYGLSSLTLVCCHRLSPSDLDRLLEVNNSELRSLFLAHTPSRDHPAPLSSLSRARYNLPALRCLSLEAERSYIDTISYLDRFSGTNLQELSLRYARGIKTEDLEALLISKCFKSLKTVEVGRCGLANLNDDSVRKLGDVARGVGVGLTVGGKSALAPDTIT
jgi:hypothetical protein